VKRLVSALFSLVIAAAGFAKAVRAQSTTDPGVAIGCRTDVLHIFADGTGPEMHTHADSVTYTVTPLDRDDRDDRGHEVRGFVSGVGFAPYRADISDQPLVPFHYDIPFALTFFDESDSLVEFHHGWGAPLMFFPGPVEIEWLGNTWLRNGVSRRKQAFLVLNLTGRNERGEFTARLADGTPVQPAGRSPQHVKDATCAIRNLVEKLRGRRFTHTFLIGHSDGAQAVLFLNGGRGFDGRRMGLALDAQGKPVFDGFIALAGACDDVGIFDPAVPVVSKMFLVDFTADDFFYPCGTFNAGNLAQRLASPDSHIADRKLASWARLYQVISPHVFPESFFNDRVGDPTATNPPPTLGAEIGGHVLALLDALIAWVGPGKDPPLSRIPGTPVVVRDVNGDGTIDSQDVDIQFTQDGGMAFAPASTLLIPWSNVAQDFISNQPFPLVAIADFGGVPFYLPARALLGATEKEIVPPTFALRRSTYDFSCCVALVNTPLSEEELERVYGRDYDSRLADYVADLATAGLWAADEPAFILNGREILNHECGTPYHDPGVFAADALHGVIHPRTDATGVDTLTPGAYTVTYDWGDHVAHRLVNVQASGRPNCNQVASQSRRVRRWLVPGPRFPQRASPRRRAN
jgi:hypothetical protein